MYQIIKSVIDSKQYELTDMIKKIEIIWLEGQITEEEKKELIEKARENATPENSYADLEKQIEKAFEEIAELRKKIESMEGTEPDPDEYPEYVQPTGAHDAYYKDDKMTFKGKKYICIAPEGIAVVWDPDAYPSYWQIVE